MRKHIARARMIAMFMLIFPVCSTVVFAGPLEDGQAAYNRGDYATALKLFRPLAEQGNADAQNNLGWLYEQGSGVKRDFKEAMKWYRSAAEQGSARAEYSLGVLYQRGSGVPKNLQDAMKWYRMAAAQGDPKAQYNLGLCMPTVRGLLKTFHADICGGVWLLKAKALPGRASTPLGNPVQCGHRFQRKADSNPVIADSR
jgi:hypothetical protein